MFHFSPRVFVQLMVAGACLSFAAGQVHAQAILATTSTTSKSSTSTPTAAWHDTTPDKLISAQVKDGVFTVDGMVAKVQLNYNINNVGYMYFFIPGAGTAVVSLSPMANAVRVKDAFDGKRLSFVADGHSFELTSKGDLGAKRDAYVQFDRSTIAVARSPRVGFGTTLQAPYVWPASKASALDKDAHLVQPPPMPASLRPVTLDPNASTTTPEAAAADAAVAARTPSKPAAPVATPQ